MKFENWLLSEEFLSIQDLQNQLNSKLNNIFHQLKGNDSHYVVISRNNTADVYIGPSDLEINKEKLIQAAKYCLKELGVKIWHGKINPNDNEIFSIPIFWYDRYAAQDYNHVANLTAKKMLEKGHAIDVADIGIETEPGVWKLNKFVNSSEYYDSKNNKWIETIGKDKETGDIFASCDGRFYAPNKPDFKYQTIWLR